MAIVATGIFAPASCSIGGMGDRATLEDNTITISGIEGLPAEAATIKAIVSDNTTGEHGELTFADINGGVVTLRLPGNIDDRYLNSFRQHAPAEVWLSDDEIRYTFIQFYVYDASGLATGRLSLESSSVWTDLLYVDRHCTVSGSEDIINRTGTKRTDLYDLKLVKGYNWTKYVPVGSNPSGNWVNGLPSGAAWVYYSMQ